MAVLAVPAFFSHDVWNPDEPRYAEVAREMLATGSFVVPRLNGEPYLEKPPLYFWLVAAASRATGGEVTAATTRLVAALAALATVLLAAALARDLEPAGSPRAGPAGLIAGLALATSVLFVMKAQTGHMDGVLTAFTTGAIVAFVRRVRRAGRQLRLWALGTVCLSAAVLTKGPVGLAVPLLAVLAARPPLRHVLTAVAGAALAAGAGLVWLSAADARLETPLRYLADSPGHARPFWFHIATLPLFLLPWAIFLPTAILEAVRRQGGRGGGAGLLLGWLGAGLLLFSAVSAKREGYILPLYPAAAVLIGLRLARAVDPGGNEGGVLPTDRSPLRRLDVVAASALAGLFAVAALAFASLPALAERVVSALPEEDREAGAVVAAALPAHAQGKALLAGAAGIAAALAGIASARARDARRLAAALGGFVLVLSTAAHALVYPALDAVKSWRPFAEDVRREQPSLAAVVYLRHEYDAIVNFYTGVVRYDVAPDAAALEAALDREGRLGVVSSRVLFDQLPPELADRLEVRAERRIGHRSMVLAAEKPR